MLNNEKIKEKLAKLGWKISDPFTCINFHSASCYIERRGRVGNDSFPIKEECTLVENRLFFNETPSGVPRNVVRYVRMYLENARS